MEKRTFVVEGMACEHCKESVEKALKGLKGVKCAEADLKGKCVMVEYEPTEVEPRQMYEAVDEAGFCMTA
ncbi:MAG: cation transporter [Bacteroidales bacterium]|nr:cation transporter [Bacteroidales bacterium]